MKIIKYARVAKSFTVALVVCSLFYISSCSSSSCSSSDIDIVKKGHLQFDKDITVGGAMDNYKYFKSTEWREFKTNQGRRIVQLTGKLTNDFFKTQDQAEANIEGTEIGVLIGFFENAETIIQFSINPDESFELQYIGLNVKTKCNESYEIKGKLGWIGSIYGERDFPVDFGNIHSKLFYDECAERLGLSEHIFGN